MKRPRNATTKSKRQKATAENTTFKVEDFLLDSEWKELLKEEFEKDYFKVINTALENGYSRNLVKPPKELVFNAFNLTSLKDVICKNHMGTWNFFILYS